MAFRKLGLDENLLQAIEKSGYSLPTAIQEKCIPEALAGKDIVGQSLTGSGKTAAFGLPTIQKTIPRAGIQALILTPTRELAVQVMKTLQKYASHSKLNITAIYGGVSMQPQYDALRISEIVVATPGRLLDHIGRRSIDLSKVKVVVLDEADKMLEMGFIEDVTEIISNVPKDHQTLLFSATIPDEIKNIVTRYMRSPIMIKEKLHVDHSLLKQCYYDVQNFEKFSLLAHLLKNKTEGLAIVFCGTRTEVEVVSKNLNKQGVENLAIHGGLSQNQRMRAVDALKRGKIQALVATDVAARGLDIQNISHVYNYDCPKNASEYTHRIGRTARAGKGGEAVLLLSSRDHDNFRSVLRDRSLKIDKEEKPEFETVASIPRERRAPQRFGNHGRGGERGHRGYRGEERRSSGRSDSRGPSRYGGNRDNRGSRRD
jgi:superfamily II DNA/RNA helicase